MTESTSVSHNETYIATESLYSVTQPVRPSSLSTAQYTTSHQHSTVQYKTQHSHYQPNANVQALYARVQKDTSNTNHHQPSPDPWAGAVRPSKGLGPPSSLAEQLKQVNINLYKKKLINFIIISIYLILIHY